MASIEDIPKKRGRPATGKDPMLTFRAPNDMVEQIELWGLVNQVPTRSEAIRRLVEKGLSDG